MEMTTWTEEDWGALLYTIQRERCILMLGPDAAIEPVNGELQPLTEILARELAGRLPPDVQKYIDPANLAQVAQYYRIEQGNNDLEAKVCGFYDARWELTSDLHRDLAALPFSLAITTTPDNMLCEAFRQQGKDPFIAHYNFRGVNPTMAPTGTPKTPLIFYLYGMTDEPDSLVLAENTLLDFLAAVIAKNPPLPNNILSELRDKNKSLLFLGFGFKQWYLRILLHVLQGSAKESRSFALEQYTPRNLEEFQRTILFFRTSDYKITLCAKELQGFVKELRTRYEQTGQTTAAQNQESPAVCLCALPQDHDAATALCDQLTTAGFRAFLPDSSQPFTAEMVKQTMDYCLVLHSPATTAPAPAVTSADFTSTAEPAIPLTLQRQIAEFLLTLPNMQESASQRALLASAGLDARLQARISVSGSSANFVQDVVDTLSRYGQLADGQPALIAILEASQEMVGQDRRDYCATLIQSVRDALAAGSGAAQQSVSPAEAYQNFKTAVRLALERQQQELKRYQFMIPVKLADCQILPELQACLTIDLTHKENVGQLISLIKRDTQRRRNKR
jgi:hypothetical protein